MNDVATLFVCGGVGGSYASLTYFGTRPSDRAKFGTHVRIDTLTLNKFDPPRGGFRGLLQNLSRHTAPKFGTHVRIDTDTLKQIDPPPTQGGLGGYIL